MFVFNQLFNGSRKLNFFTCSWWRPKLTNINYGNFLLTFFQRRRFFRYRPIRNKNCLWWPCLLTDREENGHRGHSIDASYQVSVNLAKRFQRRRFKKNWPIRNKNCLWWPCLVMDHIKKDNSNVSWLFLAHLAKAMWAFASLVVRRLSFVNFFTF
jgi:hypothetical protein